MLRFCTTNFPVLRRTRPDAKRIVLSERCVYRKISSNRTEYSQKCVSPVFKTNLIEPQGKLKVWQNEHV